MSFSKITLTGKVSSEIDLRNTQDGTEVASFSAQTSNNISLQCNCWGNVATAVQNLQQGELVLVVGSLITFSQKSDNGTYGNKTFQVNVREISRLDALPENLLSSQDMVSSMTLRRPSQPPKKTTDISDILDDKEDDLPF